MQKFQLYIQKYKANKKIFETCGGRSFFKRAKIIDKK